MLRLDHIAISAETLDAGAALVAAALGVGMVAGGQHPLMSTHNRLLGLGDLYLEVIAADPAAPPPGRPRWFDLDGFSGPPRLTNWIVQCDDLGAEVAASPPGAGRPIPLARGAFRWQMAVPADGRLPFDGAFPALIQWEGDAHPARHLPESGVRLLRFEIAHPAAESLAAALAGRFSDPRVVIREAPEKAMRATFSTPDGTRVIG